MFEYFLELFEWVEFLGLIILELSMGFYFLFEGNLFWLVMVERVESIMMLRMGESLFLILFKLFSYEDFDLIIFDYLD